MTIQSQVSTFIARNYQIFAGLDVDKHSIAVTFCNHEGLLQSLRLPIVRRSCSIRCGSNFRSSDWPLFTKLGQRASASTMSWWQRAILFQQTQPRQ